MKKTVLYFTLLLSVTLQADWAYTKGVKSYSAKQYTEALRYFYISARSRNINAYAKLGFMHEYGIGTATNSQIAFYWYEKSAQNNHAEAQYRLGHLYETGIGVKRDRDRASSWYQRAANSGNRYAKARLAGESIKAGSPMSKTDEEYRDKLMLFKSKKEQNVTTDQSRTIEQNRTFMNKLKFWR